MACPDVEHLLDAFVDTELSSSELLDVARHAAACPACDGAIREITALRQSVAVLVDREAGELDFSGVWPAVAAAIPSRGRLKGRILTLARPVPAAPIWGAAVAIAASALLWFAGPGARIGPGQGEPGQPVGQMVASATGPGRALRSANHADIDRLAGKGIAVRREPKSGTTIIWVNQAVEGAR